METNEDQSIRHDYNACMTLGMTKYNALRQLAAAYLTTADLIRESLAHTEWAD